MSKHFFFVDDSGSRAWETPYSRQFVVDPPPRTDENINFWRRNYFVLGGIHIGENKVAELNPLIDKQKVALFGTKHVEIKSDWLRSPHQRKKHYIDPFGVNEADLKTFVDDFWYKLFAKDNLTVQAFVLDKRYFAGKRAVTTPLGIMTQMRFDRLVLYSTIDEERIVIFDQMESDVRAIRGDQEEILRVSKQEINASPFFSQYAHSDVRFEKSSNNNFLQLADTAAYNIFRQFVDNGDQWENPTSKKLRVYSYLERIDSCLHCSDDGIIAGFGVIKHPNPTKLKWARAK